MVYHLYVSVSGEDKVSIFTVDSVSGRLEAVGDTAMTGRPAPMAASPDRRLLYVGRRGALEIATFRIDPQSGALTLTGSAPLEDDPNFLATDRTGRYLFSAYYQGGKIGVHPIGSDGVAATPPVEWLKTATGAHSLQTDPSNKFAFVPHIAGRGPNRILQFKFDQSTGRLTPNSPPWIAPEQQLGPRHFCFHPTKDILYCSNEQGGSVSAYHFDPSAGTLKAFQTVSTLPAGYAGENLCSQIQITPSGRYLYSPNRGHDSIAGFSVDPADGSLSGIGQTPTEAVPRAFSLDPDGNFLFAAGLESGRLASYKIDTATGKLEPLESYTVGGSPMWVLIITLPT